MLYTLYMVYTVYSSTLRFSSESNTLVRSQLHYRNVNIPCQWCRATCRGSRAERRCGRRRWAVRGWGPASGSRPRWGCRGSSPGQSLASCMAWSRWACQRSAPSRTGWPCSWGRWRRPVWLASGPVLTWPAGGGWCWSRPGCGWCRVHLRLAFSTGGSELTPAETPVSFHRMTSKWGEQNNLQFKFSTNKNLNRRKYQIKNS